jgi:hypothetical protein
MKLAGGVGVEGSGRPSAIFIVHSSQFKIQSSKFKVQKVEHFL